MRYVAIYLLDRSVIVPYDLTRFSHTQKTEATSAAVLSQLKAQRGQLKGAHENVWEMRQAAEKAKTDISSMIKKARQKKMRLQAIATILASIDFLLLIRLIQCGGSFFCRRYK